MRQNDIQYTVKETTLDIKSENYVYESFSMKIQQLLNSKKSNQNNLDQEEKKMDINLINRIDSDKQANFILKNLCTTFQA